MCYNRLMDNLSISPIELDAGKYDHAYLVNQADNYLKDVHRRVQNLGYKLEDDVLILSNLKSGFENEEQFDAHVNDLRYQRVIELVELAEATLKNAIKRELTALQKLEGKPLDDEHKSRLEIATNWIDEQLIKIENALK